MYKILMLFYPVIEAVLKFCSNINWTAIKKLLTGREYELTAEDHEKIKAKLRESYYFILIRRKSHLTTYLISLGSFLTKGKWGYWSHALCNVEDEVKTDEDYKLIESTKAGVHWSSFYEVFNCDSVVLLKPKNLSKEEYNSVLDDVILELQAKLEYDFILNINDPSRVSCVELLYQAIVKAGYIDRFPNLVKLIKDINNLTPDMFYDCGDFEVELEIRR